MILYYFPGKKGVSADDFVAAGLAHALEEGLPIRTAGVWANGPDGGGGQIAVVDAGDPDRGYYPDRQCWRQVPAQNVWAGVWTDRPFDPESLARRRPIPGNPVELADGREWLVPIVRRWVSDETGAGWCPALPVRSRLDESGQWQPGAVIEKYARLWEIASNWDDALHAAVTEEIDDGKIRATFDFAGKHEAALTVLGHNYRLGAIEADLLGLLSDAHCQEILFVTIDFAERLAWQQKKTEQAAAGGNSSPGPAAGCQATDQR